MPNEGWDFANAEETLHITPQKHLPPLNPRGMEVVVQTHPPLGQVSFRTHSSYESGIPFTVLLEVPSQHEAGPWQVCLWSSTTSGGWEASPFSQLPTEECPQDLQAARKHVFMLYFRTKIPFQPKVQFTIRFRQGDDGPWRWAREELGFDDGILITSKVPEEPTIDNNIRAYIPDLADNWKVSALSKGPNQTSRLQTWSLECLVPGSVNDRPSTTDVPVGVPWGGPLRWFALVRTWTPWLAPRHGRTHFHLDKDAMLCSFLGPMGKHVVLLGLSGLDHVTPLFVSREQDEKVIVRARNESDLPQKTITLVSVSDNFQDAVSALLSLVRDVHLRARASTYAQNTSFSEASSPSETLEEALDWNDGLGFCTWNALGQRLSKTKIIHALDKLAESNIKITKLIIDDNWQSIDYKGDGQFQHAWLAFEAEPEAFPTGLKGMVSQIREKHPHICHIAVWHALLGYWGGVSPDGDIAARYRTVQVDRENSTRRHLPLGGKMTVVAKEDVKRFYDDFYSFLVSCGIDSVKTDGQFMVDTWVSASDRRDLTNEYLDSWRLAVKKHFGTKAISCMSQVPNIIQRTQLSRGGIAFHCRNSDDFFPEVPSSHPWHVWTNAHNAHFTQYTNTLPDWDMFQTVHDYSDFHAAARCLSGGPIYITDVPGEHNLDLLKQISAVTPKGKTIILRSARGRSLDVYNDYQDGLLLKIISHCGDEDLCASILGVFNVSSHKSTEFLPLDSFPGVHPGVQYVVRAHTTGRVSTPMEINRELCSRTSLSVALNVRGFEIFTAFPLTEFHHESGEKKVHVANLGLLGKMTGIVAVTRNILIHKKSSVYLSVVIKALGVLGVYLSNLPELNISHDLRILIHGSNMSNEAISVSPKDRHVLQIDLETAWGGIGSKLDHDEVRIDIEFPLCSST